MLGLLESEIKSMNLFGADGNFETTVAVSRWSAMDRVSEESPIGAYNGRISCSSSYPAVYRYATFGFITDHKYYIQAYLRGDSDNSYTILATDLHSLFESKTAYASGWVKRSKIIIATTDSELRIGTSIGNKYCRIDGLQIYDLTEMYGEGNEPDLTTCDDIFSSFSPIY